MGVIMNGSNTDDNNDTDNNDVIKFEIQDNSGTIIVFKITKIEDKLIDIELTNNNIIVQIVRNHHLYCSFDVLKQIIDSMSSYYRFQERFLKGVDTDHEFYKNLTSQIKTITFSSDQVSMRLKYTIPSQESEYTILFEINGATNNKLHNGTSYTEYHSYNAPFNFSKLQEIVSYCNDDTSIYILCRCILDTCCTFIREANTNFNKSF